MQPPNQNAAKVLLVEDDEDTRHVYATVLRHAGYEVVEALDGSASVDQARDERPDLILMDVNVPGIDGREAARRIKSDPTAAFIPLLAFSGRVDCVADIRGDAGAFDGFIAKPVRPSELVRRVRAYLELTGSVSAPLARDRLALASVRARRATRESASQALPDETASR